MRLLIDTQIFIWSVLDSELLCPRARQIMLDADRVYVSAASIWEIAIKSKIGKLQGDPHEFAMAIVQSGFHELVITSRHAAVVHDLPLHHRDPFDRLLLSQVVSEPMHFLTSDSLLGKYSELVLAAPGGLTEGTMPTICDSRIIALKCSVSLPVEVVQENPWLLL